MKYIARERNSKEDIITESPKALNFFYGNFFGRLILRLVITKPISNLVALYMNSGLSRHRIKRFVNKNDINMFEYDDRRYKSYNDFFTRKVLSEKRPINTTKGVLISPCDSKLSAYKIEEDLTLNIKGSYYSINSLVDKNIIDEYKEGLALVFRLSTDNYHRYCYIDGGSKGKNFHIKGVYHTVQPISLKRYNFYKTNAREWTILNTNNFGKVIDIDIGALSIGRIHNNHETYIFKKGEEKGYFEFGGSTIVLLFKKNVVKLDDDIYNNSKEGIETIVKYGERIGKSNFLTRIINKIIGN
jgi:phosphatidylserine decarboxylase